MFGVNYSLKREIKGYTIPETKHYNTDININIQENIEKIYILTNSLSGIELSIENYIKALLLILIKKNKIYIVDNQSHLILKLTEGYQGYNLTVPELYVLDIVERMDRENQGITLPALYTWVENNIESIKIDYNNNKKEVRKELVNLRYIDSQRYNLIADVVIVGTDYIITDKGLNQVNDIVGFLNYIEDINILGYKLKYSKELWDNLMIWGTLYGKEKSVRKYLKRINSEYYINKHLNIGYIAVRMRNTID